MFAETRKNYEFEANQKDGHIVFSGAFGNLLKSDSTYVLVGERLIPIVSYKLEKRWSASIERELLLATLAEYPDAKPTLCCERKGKMVSICELDHIIHVLLDETALILRDLSWQDDLLCLSFSCCDVDARIVSNSSVFVEAYSGDKVLTHCECTFIKRDGGLLSASIPLSKIAKKLSEKTRTNVRFRVAFNCGSWRIHSAPANLKRQHKECFKRFVSGFWHNDKVTVIPDEAANNDYVLRVIGKRANTANEPYAVEKRDRPVENCILLRSLRSGGAITKATAEMLEKKTLLSSARVDRDGLPHLDCQVEGVSYSVSLENTCDLREVTLLDEGKHYIELTKAFYGLQEREEIFDMMLEFDELCRKNDIEYWLAYGSLLGVIRHEGVIPWDNDADFLMTERNYKKLKSVIEDGLAPENRVLEDWMTCPGYPGSFGRYMISDSTQLDFHQSRGKGGIGGFGIVVDVFYLLPAWGSLEDAIDRRYTFIAYDELANRHHRSKGTRPDACMERYVELRKRQDEIGREALLAELRAEFFGRDDTDATYYFPTSTANSRNVVFRKEWLETIEVPIRGHNFPIPRAYLDVLRVMYGPSYRNYPPGERCFPEKRLLKSQMLPYSYVKDGYLSECDSSEVMRNRSALKELSMEETLMRRETSPSYYLLEGHMLSLKLQDAIGKIDVGKIENGIYKDIDAVFTPYFEMQTSSKFVYWPVLVPIPDDVLSMALDDLISYRGDTTTASIITEIRCDKGGAMNSRLAEMVETVGLLSKMRDEFEYGRQEQASALAQSILADHKYAVEAKTLIWIIEILDSSNSNDGLEGLIKDEIERTDSHWPLLALALLLEKQGKHQRAMGLSSYILHSTDDGMMIKYVSEHIGGRA